LVDGDAAQALADLRRQGNVERALEPRLHSQHLLDELAAPLLAAVSYRSRASLIHNPDCSYLGLVESSCHKTANPFVP
jgi:hypothetical protein